MQHFKSKPNLLSTGTSQGILKLVQSCHKLNQGKNKKGRPFLGLENLQKSFFSQSWKEKNQTQLENLKHTKNWNKTNILQLTPGLRNNFVL